MQVREMTELEKQVKEDFDWALRSAEVQQNPEYSGKWVVVHKKRVLAAGTDRHAMVEQAAKEVGVPRGQLVVMIVPPAEAWEVPD